MKFLILFGLMSFGCTLSQQTSPKEMILGSWVYITAESLGDYSQNDTASIAEFNKGMEGRMLTFYKDSIYKATKKVDGQEAVLQTGQYSIATDGKSMKMGNDKSVKVSLTDTIFKFYSPNSGAFVWRKVNQ